MITYMGYRIVPKKSNTGRRYYDVYAENHWQDGRITWEKTAGGYGTIETAKAACRAHFGRL